MFDKSVMRLLVLVSLLAIASCQEMRDMREVAKEPPLEGQEVQQLSGDIKGYLQERFPTGHTILVLSPVEHLAEGPAFWAQLQVTLQQAGFGLAPLGTPRADGFHDVQCRIVQIGQGTLLLDLKIDGGDAARLYSRDDLTRELHPTSAFTVRM